MWTYWALEEGMLECGEEGKTSNHHPSPGTDRYQQDDGFKKRFDFGRGGGRRGGRGQSGQGYDDRTFQRDKGGAPPKDRPHQRGPHEGVRGATREYNCLSGSNRTDVRATSKQDNTLNKRKAKETPKSKVSKGEDMSRWEKMNTLRKKNEEEVGKDEECEDIEIPQRVGKQWDVLDIGIQYKGSDTGSGGYGYGCGGIKENQERPPIAQPREREYVPSISPKEILTLHKTAEHAEKTVCEESSQFVKRSASLWRVQRASIMVKKVPKQIVLWTYRAVFEETIQPVESPGRQHTVQLASGQSSQSLASPASL
ncbi:hypothetical protein GE061_008647 [Apolygus lucorum]|uniref:Uncharacterized protein n=1 Tax=Apolygus lucorum TaxID=248454 RepID=A0A8S9WNB0_APOLU|nr:hypothetical protein GE061_008647 [Apolygus lucorum]